MKKQLLFLALSLLMILTGCRKEDDFGGASLQPVPFTVSVKFDAGVGGNPAKNAAVSLKNSATGDVITGTTDANGELKFAAVLPGQYTINASLTLSQQQYFDTFGITTSKPEVFFNGGQENATINANVSSTTITLSSGTVGDFVIKQYYYAGSNTTQGASFRDHFIEIYNNSNEVLYADGLYIATLEGNTNSTLTSYTLPTGQYDWSQSTGNSIGSAANTDFVYASNVIKVPGTGTQYPVQPGESIVIAQTAINHKAPYTNNNGVNVGIQNPALTVDLSTADFETYLGDYEISNGGTPYVYDIQNPAVPDMGIVYWSGVSKDLLLNLSSRPALVIFKDVTDAQIAAYAKVPNPKDLTGRLYMRLPKDIIMDGIDITNAALTAPKDLPNNIDAGKAYIQDAAGQSYADYTGYAVIRKTKSTIGNRKVLEDTNNSTNDFVTIKAEPRTFAP